LTKRESSFHDVGIIAVAKWPVKQIEIEKIKKINGPGIVQ